MSRSSRIKAGDSRLVRGRRARWPLTAALLVWLVALAASVHHNAQARRVWHVVFDGGGVAYVHGDSIEVVPRAAVRPDETHSALAVSVESFADLGACRRHHPPAAAHARAES